MVLRPQRDGHIILWEWIPAPICHSNHRVIVSGDASIISIVSVCANGRIADSENDAGVLVAGCHETAERHVGVVGEVGEVLRIALVY